MIFHGIAACRYCAKFVHVVIVTGCGGNFYKTFTISKAFVCRLKILETKDKSENSDAAYFIIRMGAVSWYDVWVTAFDMYIFVRITMK